MELTCIFRLTFQSLARRMALAFCMTLYEPQSYSHFQVTTIRETIPCLRSMLIQRGLRVCLLQPLMGRRPCGRTNTRLDVESRHLLSSILVDLGEGFIVANLLEGLDPAVVEVTASFLGQVWNFRNQRLHTDYVD